MPSRFVDAIESAAINATGLEQYLFEVENIFSDYLGAVEFKIATFDETQQILTFHPRSMDLNTPGLTGQISESDNPMIRVAKTKMPIYLQGKDFITRAFGEISNIWFEELLIEQIWIVPGPSNDILIGFTNELTRLTESDKEALNLIINLEPSKQDLDIHQQIAKDKKLLTKRQLEVLEHLAEAFTNKQIAKAMNLSESTIKQETMQIYEVLGVKTRTEAVKYYFKNLLIK